MKASIIVLAYNQLEDGTKPCIESIYKNTPVSDFELIVVDNNSIDGTVNYLKSIENKYDNLKIILNYENKGYAGGNNDGMKVASGDFIILLNNDTVVTENWLERLLSPFYVDKKIGIIGPISNYAGTEQKIKIEANIVEEAIKLGVDYASKNKDIFFDSPKLSFFCVAIRREVFEKIGLLDEAFGIGMFEDDDYSVRVKKAGYRVVVNEGCFIYHKGSLSFSKLGDKKYAEVFNKNKDIFFRKHNVEWTFSDVALSYYNKIRDDLKGVDCKNNGIERALVRIDDFGILLNHLKNIELSSGNNSRGGRMSFVGLLKLRATSFIRKYPKIKKIIFFIKNILESNFRKFLFKILDFLKSIDDPYSYFCFIKKIKIIVLDKNFPKKKNYKFSLITTIRNESDNIERFIEMINKQTMKPSEVIIVDGGSCDDTVLKIKNCVKKYGININIIEAGDVNIAKGRNIALKNCNFEHVVVTDAGSEMDKNFCKNLVSCFYCDKNVDLVGGISLAKSDIPQDWLIPKWDRVNWKKFLPSSRSLAIKKTLALKIGGYPEYLTKTGEDTLFDVNYRNISKKWAFNKKAVVYWRNPKTLEESKKLAFSYGFGDGESGVGDFLYSKYLYEYLKSKRLPEFEPQRSFFLGYLNGMQRRDDVLKRANFNGFNEIYLPEINFKRDVIKKIKLQIDRSIKEKKGINIYYDRVKKNIFNRRDKVLLENFTMVRFIKKR